MFRQDVAGGILDQDVAVYMLQMMDVKLVSLFVLESNVVLDFVFFDQPGK